MIDKETNEEAQAIFKELNLTQEQAQKLVDIYSKHGSKNLQEHVDKANKWWNDQQRSWRDEMKADPKLSKLLGSNQNFGPDSPIVITVNAALASLQDPKLTSDFKAAMDVTGAGNNPAFVKVLYALASMVTEGTSYAAGGVPTPVKGRPTPGQALYPNLPSGAG